MDLRFCDKHSVQYNPEEGSCALCIADGKPPETFPKAQLDDQPMKLGPKVFDCPYCGSKTSYEGSCSKYHCRKKAGLNAHGKPVPSWQKCGQCGARTKNTNGVCNEFKCWKAIGKKAEWYRKYAPRVDRFL